MLTIEKEYADEETETELPEPPEPEKPETTYTKDMARYEISTNSWTYMTAMNEKRGNAFTGTVADKIYVIGGLTSDNLGVSDKTEEYDALNDVWSYKAVDPIPRFGGMSITVGSDIYTIGGVGFDDDNDSYDTTVKMEVYHSDTDEWEELADMPIIDEGLNSEERLGVAFGTAQLVQLLDGSDIKNYIYVLSGINEFNITSNSYSVERYNERIIRYCIEDDVWEYSEVLRSNELNTYQRIAPLSLVYANKIFVFDGAIEEGTSFIYPQEDFFINVLTPIDQSVGQDWLTIDSTFLEDFPYPKYQSAIVKYDIDPSNDDADYYIIGGANSDSGALDIVEKITTTSGTFIYESSYDENNSVALTPLPLALHGLSAAVLTLDEGSLGINTYIYTIGGFSLARDSNFVDINFDI